MVGIQNILAAKRLRACPKCNSAMTKDKQLVGNKWRITYYCPKCKNVIHEEEPFV